MIQQPARVVAQVEDQRPRPVPLRLLDGRPQLLVGLLVEPEQLDQGDLVLLVHEEVPFLGIVQSAQIAQYGVHLDLGADHRDIHGVLRALVQHRERDFLARIALDQIDYFIETHVFRRFAVHLDD